VSETDFALVQTRLRELHVHLQVVHSGIFVSAAALHQQNAERDEEIARVLEHFVAPRLWEQVQRTAELIASLQTPPLDAAELDSWDPRPGGTPRY
jgi:hypothetical protein